MTLTVECQTVFRLKWTEIEEVAIGNKKKENQKKRRFLFHS